MEHKKTYYQKDLITSVGHLVIEGPIHAEQLEGYEFHEDLVSFRPASKQHQALIEWFCVSVITLVLIISSTIIVLPLINLIHKSIYKADLIEFLNGFSLYSFPNSNH